VFAAVLATARLGLRVNVTGWLALAENMPSGTAVRPGDVLRMYGPWTPSSQRRSATTAPRTVLQVAGLHHGFRVAADAVAWRTHGQ
jgi:hypothetical protein